MDSGFYAACTALVSRTKALDTIANNLANASTVGYRAQQNVFSSMLAAANTQISSPLNQAINSYGLLSGTNIDLGQGAQQKTGNELDLAIEGSGFFVVQTQSGTMYTRNGSFHVSSSGQLATANGDLVLGTQGPIAIIPGPISISEDGTISSNGAIEGKLRLAQFRLGAALSSAGESYYSAPASSVIDAADSKITQGALESSNVNSISSVVELISAQRSAEMMQRALAMFNSELDKTATQDLPKIG